MIPIEKQTIFAILETLTKISYTALIEVRRSNNASNEDIIILENNQRILIELIQKITDVE